MSDYLCLAIKVVKMGYIHLNPLRIKKSKDSQEKRWHDLSQNDQTSLPGYINQRNWKEFVHYRIVLDYFGGDTRKSRTEYRSFVEEGFRKEVPSPLEKGKGTGIIGKENFVEEIKQLFVKDKKSSREQPALRELRKGIAPNE